MTLAAGETFAIPLDAAGLIAADLPCASCEYNLRAQAPEGTCPECGSPVRDAMQNLLQRLGAKRIAGIQTGILWVGLAIVTQVVGTGFGVALLIAMYRSIPNWNMFLLQGTHFLTHSLRALMVLLLIARCRWLTRRDWFALMIFAAGGAVVALHPGNMNRSVWLGATCLTLGLWFISSNTLVRMRRWPAWSALLAIAWWIAWTGLAAGMAAGSVGYVYFLPSLLWYLFAVIAIRQLVELAKAARHEGLRKRGLWVLTACWIVLVLMVALDGFIWAYFIVNSAGWTDTYPLLHVILAATVGPLAIGVLVWALVYLGAYYRYLGRVRHMLKSIENA